MAQLHLNLEANLHENVAYQDHIMPLSICIDHFDRYYHRERPSHWHEEIEISVLQKGQLEYQIFDNQATRQTVTLNPGEGIFINSSALHSAKALTPGTLLNTIIVPLPLFNLAPFNTIQKKYILPIIHSPLTYFAMKPADSPDREILSIIATICALSEASDAYELQSFELVCRLWRNLLTKFNQMKEQLGEGVTTVRYDRVKQIIQFIHENYSHPITITDMSVAIGISRAECFRCFKESFNDTPANYLNKYRMSMAAILLANASLSVAEISTACGFQSPSYFGKKFRQYFHVTPKAYQLELEQNTN